MVKLPEQFIENMKKQLPENEWEAFFAIYGNPPFKGVRLNPLKGGRDALKPLLPFLGEPIPWEENGFYTVEEVSNLSGFSDPKYFSTIYKKRFGHSPSFAKRMN
jgi:AraC-like DNA-binding protein